MLQTWTMTDHGDIEKSRIVSTVPETITLKLYALHFMFYVLCFTFYWSRFQIQMTAIDHLLDVVNHQDMNHLKLKRKRCLADTVSLITVSLINTLQYDMSRDYATCNMSHMACDM